MEGKNKTPLKFNKMPDLEKITEDEFSKLCKIRNKIKLGKLSGRNVNKTPRSLVFKKYLAIKKGHSPFKLSRYTSVILAFGKGKKIRNYRIAYLKTKVSMALILISILLAGGFYYISYTKLENVLLKQSLAELKRSSLLEKTEVAEKFTLLDELIKDYEKSEREMDKFIKDYERVIGRYLEGRITVAVAARSGTRAGSNFINDINELRFILTELEDLSSDQDYALIDIKQATDELGAYLDSLPTLRPAKGKISSGFGNRRDPFTGRISFHKGIDIAGKYGSNILASGVGTVIFTGTYKELGKTIMIDHGNDLITIYGHTSSILVENGDQVGKGDIIGKVGSTGRSTGAHLHFEVRINDTPVDPDGFLDKD